MEAEEEGRSRVQKIETGGRAEARGQRKEAEGIGQRAVAEAEGRG